jgi:HD-GYP domain-containing protein (c-di-GMP phosphodiesterase class II)
MRLLSIDNARENMEVARNIYTADGGILLAEGMKLNARYIQRLKDFQIYSLYITDDLIGKVEIDELVHIQTRNDANKILKDTMSHIHDNQGVKGETVYKVVNDIIDEIIRNRKVAYGLMDIRAMNDYLFGHSLTVCILSVMIGVSAGYNFQQLKELGVGAILHDVGKVLIPDTIVNKKDKLTPEEYREIQKHAQFGYDVLKKSEDISSVAAHVAWAHHERIDGSGYPRGIKGKEIHEYARIVAITDVYDALSSDRIYRPRMLAHEAIEFIRDGSKEQLDPEFLKLFLENVSPFPIGTMVLLNNGEQALVIKTPRDFPARPIVRVLYDKDNKPVAEPLDRDLRKDLTVFIVSPLKDTQ